MSIVFGYVVAYSVYTHNNSYKYEHLSTSSSYWSSLALTVIICLTLLIVWMWRELPSTAWEIIQRVELKLRKIFPTIVALVTTIIGMFTTFALLRPHLKIANTVAFIPKTNRLVFNVVNKGLFKVQNLKPELYKCKYQSNKVIESINLDLSNISSLDWRFAHADLCCWDVATPKEEAKRVNEMLRNMDDSQCLELRVSSNHIISGKNITEIKTFYKNDILVGKFKGDTLYSIDEDGKLGSKLITEKDVLYNIHKIILILEVVIGIILILDLGWLVGGQLETYRNYYIFAAKLLSICLYISELARLWTDVPVETSYNEKWSYVEFLIPINDDNLLRDSNHQSIFCFLKRTIGNKIKQFINK